MFVLFNVVLAFRRNLDLKLSRTSSCTTKAAGSWAEVDLAKPSRRWKRRRPPAVNC